MSDNQFPEEMLQEFNIEATDLLDQAETDLLKAESGNYGQIYDSIFRVFHSLKGGAGMLGLVDLQKHMHSLESILTGTKGKAALSKAESDFFLAGVDASKKLLDGQKIVFSYILESEQAPAASTSSLAAPASAQPTASAVSRAAPQVASSSPASRPAPAATVPLNKSLEKPIGLAYAVDDEPEILSLISDSLGEANIECKTFEDPMQLFEACKTRVPDLILSDIKMPQMSGLEVLKKLRGDGIESPVILVSGWITKEALLTALESGVHTALEKPFNHTTLINHSLAALRHYHLQKMLRRSINLLLYQFTDLDDFLVSSGKTDAAQSIRTELKALMEQNKALHSTKPV